MVDGYVHRPSYISWRESVCRFVRFSFLSLYAFANVLWPVVLCFWAVCVSVCASQTLLTQCLLKYWRYFHQTFSINAFWDRHERFNFWGQKVKGQGHDMTKGAAGRQSIQSSVLCVRVLISSSFLCCLFC